MYKSIAHLAKRMKLKIALFLIVLDHFKEINDTFGHQTGDEILINTGKLLLNLMRKNDIAVRLGGDEFLFLALIDKKNDAKELANRILRNLHKPININGKQFETKPSIGLSVSTKSSVTLDSLIKEADANMYQAKEKGGDQWSN